MTSCDVEPDLVHDNLGVPKGETCAVRIVTAQQITCIAALKAASVQRRKD